MAKKEIKISKLGSLPRDIDDLDILPVVSQGKTYEVSTKELLRKTFKLDDNTVNSVTGWSSEKISNELLNVDSFPEAPIDGTQYARKDAGWVSVVASGMSGFELPSGTAPQGTTYKMLPKPSETSVRTIKYNLDPVDYDGDGEPELYIYSQNQAFSNLWLEGQLFGSLENGPENWVSVGIYANYPVLFFVTQGESRSNTFYFGDYTFTLDPEAYPWTSNSEGGFSMQLLSPLESLPDSGITEPLHHGNSPTEIQNLYDQVYNDMFITENIIEIKTYPMREFVYQDGWIEFNPSRIVTSIPTDESTIEDSIDTVYYVI